MVDANLADSWYSKFEVMGIDGIVKMRTDVHPSYTWKPVIVLCSVSSGEIWTVAPTCIVLMCGDELDDHHSGRKYPMFFRVK